MIMFKDYKQQIIIFSFYLTSSLAIFFSIFIEQKSPPDGPPQTGNRHQEVSEFSFSHYYINKKERPYAYLKSTYLAMNHSTNIANYKNPIGHLFTSKMQIVNYKADEGDYFQETQNINLNKNVLIYDEEMEVKSDRAEYYQNKDFFRVMGDVKSKFISQKNGDKVYIDSDYAYSWPNAKQVHYFDNVVGKIIRKRPYEPRTDFSCQLLKASQNDSLIELERDVYIKRLNMHAKSLRGEIYLDNYNKEVKYYTLFDDVKVTEKFKDKNTGKTLERKSFSEKLEGFAKLKKIVLTGYPKVIQGNDVVKGNIITFYENSEIVEVNDNNSSFIIKE